MQKVALIVSLAALGTSGWLAYSQGCLPCEVRSLRSDVDALSALESRLGALEDRMKVAPGAPRTVSGPAGRSTAGGSSTDDPLSEPPPLAGAPARAPAAAAPVAETVGALEKRLAALEEKAKAQEAAPTSVARRFVPTLPNGGHIYGSVDDAKDDLALTDPQKADFDRILADARRQLDEIRKLPDDEGKTLEGVTKEMFQPGADGAIRLDLGKSSAFRAKRIPGRNETYGQAEQRVRTEARRQMRDALSSEQQAKFDKSNTDPMLGGGGAMMTSFTVATDGLWQAPGMDGK